MKTRILAVALTLALALTALCGCGAKKDYSGVTVDPDALAKAFTDAGLFSEELGRLDPDAASAVYGLRTAKAYTVYAGSGATPEELIVCKAGDDPGALDGELREHLKKRKNEFTTYNPEQKPKLSGALIFTAGDWVIYAVTSSETPTAAEEALAAYLDTLI